MKSKLRVIAGHGGSDPGAVNGALTERELNIAAVLSFNDAASRDWLVPAGQVEVITYPKDAPFDGTTGLADKIAKANAAGSDQLLIEVHHNVAAAGNDTQIWYSQNASTTPGDETWQVLPHLAREFGFLIGRPIPQLSSDHSRFGKLGILDDVTCTAILIEARNVDMLASPEWEYAFGVALAQAMARYFGWSPAIMAVPPPPPVIDDRLARAKKIAAEAAVQIAAL